jgi:hypothetical protein
MALVSDVMVDQSPAGGDDRLLFCPFCRECYEGRSHCPEHELELVEFQALPRQQHERQVRWDEPFTPWDLRFGRLEIVLGVVASLVGFFALPFVEGSFDERPIAWTALEVAARPAKNLWTVPVVATFFFVLLLRRRTPLQLRAARLAGVLAALMPLVSLGYSLWNVQRGVEARYGAVALDWGAGAWVMGAGALLFLVGSARLGRLPTDERMPHGAAPGDAAPGDGGARIEAEPRPRKRRRR